MLELPEAIVLAEQINQTLTGKKIVQAVANQSPHKFAWYTGDPAEYNQRLAGKTVGAATACGGHVETRVEDMLLVTSTSLRYYPAGEKVPAKHQLLLEFADSTALTGHVQMWGVLLCLREGQDIGLKDYNVARAKPSPLSTQFDEAYFMGLQNEETGKLSAKAFLATEQRIPGLGNGVLQDILWTAHVHPKRKMEDLSPEEVQAMYRAVKKVLGEMTAQGGRDAERDLFGHPGGYLTRLCSATAGQPCPVCGSLIRKEAYLGGSIYYCPGCQLL